MTDLFDWADSRPEPMAGQVVPFPQWRRAGHIRETVRRLIEFECANPDDRDLRERIDYYNARAEEVQSALIACGFDAATVKQEMNLWHATTSQALTRADRALREALNG